MDEWVPHCECMDKTYIGKVDNPKHKFNGFYEYECDDCKMKWYKEENSDE